MPSAPSGQWVWIDLEMTGLVPKTCRVLEIASVVTDLELNIIGEGPDIVIHESDEVLENMSPWCIEHHAESGLTDACRQSTTSLREAEEQTLAFLREHTTEKQSALCGNSIGLDWRFIRVHMPELDDFLGDQLIDVTAIKELQKRWFPTTERPKKAGGHRALVDIRESIDELKLYKRTIFR